MILWGQGAANQLNSRLRYQDGLTIVFWVLFPPKTTGFSTIQQKQSSSIYRMPFFHHRDHSDLNSSGFSDLPLINNPLTSLFIGKTFLFLRQGRLLINWGLIPLVCKLEVGIHSNIAYIFNVSGQLKPFRIKATKTWALKRYLFPDGF